MRAGLDVQRIAARRFLHDARYVHDHPAVPRRASCMYLMPLRGQPPATREPAVAAADGEGKRILRPTRILTRWSSVAEVTSSWVTL